MARPRPPTAGRLVNTLPLHAGTWESNLEGKRAYFTGGASGDGVLDKLQVAMKRRLPMKLGKVKLSVFGFSRGAAQARAFCHFVHHLLLKQEGAGYTLAGVPFELKFLGLFDSVASVGLPDSSPFWRGLGGWANGTLEIAPCVQRTVHLCAAHEIRINFPLSTARSGNAYPANCVEKVYPGAHSNVGGGYAPGAQGKSVGSRARLLSQIPLGDMYHEARMGGAPLLSVAELLTTDDGKKTALDLRIDPDCIALFNAYREWSHSVGGSVEAALHGHTQLYWRWLVRHRLSVAELPSFKHAGAQDRIDMFESHADFNSDEANALTLRQAVASSRPSTAPHAASLPAMTQAQRDFLRVRDELAAMSEPRVPPLVERFFDEMVHDSHASFYMVGPATAYDRQEKIKEIDRRLDANRRYEEWVKTTSAMMARQSGTPSQPLPPIPERDMPESLSNLEQRIFDYQKTHPGEYPPLTDADRDQLLAMEDMTTSGAVRLVTRKTRRELGGHVRYRRVFDRS